ncbi:hypothetical protein GQ53DRAFT_806054 [Thozetella sp. PMI_491]|nr:hypothetical protein GQ53DRAFT_806054 [Thozetella sp. PMI_491]
MVTLNLKNFPRNLPKPRKPWRFRFLDLPIDIRLIIYRFLLKQANVIRADFVGFLLHPQITRTCRGIYREALPILYSENTWSLEVTFSRSEPRAWWDSYELGRDETLKHTIRGITQFIPEYSIGTPFKLLRDIEVVIDLNMQPGAWFMHHDYKTNRRKVFSAIHSASSELSVLLSDLLNLTNLRVEILGECLWRTEGTEVRFANRYSPALKPWAWLRHVKHVDFAGVVAPEWAEQLSKTMTQAGTIDHLPKAYNAMGRFMRKYDIEIDKYLMSKAHKAAQRGNLERFMELRSLMIEPMTDEMLRGRKLLYEYDNLLQATQ